ncbi:hypothetical protein [Planococcus sp. YIM B11945]|uniref:hypothetical protein n=1 Tax=Planococcus sp. YIM B11945 TaxID=3435410 RepID=UPI003D7DAD80
MKKRLVIFGAILLAAVLLYSLTYIPRHITNLTPSDISKITVFDGGKGFEVEIKEKADIAHIIQNLNSVTFQKDKPSLGYMGYSFNMTIYNDKGKAVKELIINSADTIRSKGFFYTAKNQAIDYDYIAGFFEE